MGCAQVIRRRDEDLQATQAGRDRDYVEELDRLVGKGREGLLCREHGDPAADISSQRLNILQRRELHLARASNCGQFLEIELGVARHYGEQVLAIAGAGDQGLEDLLRRQADLAGNRNCGEVIGVDVVGAQFVRNVQCVELPRRVGLARLGGGTHRSVSTSDTSRPAFSVSVLCASGLASSAWWVVSSSVRARPLCEGRAM